MVHGRNAMLIRAPDYPSFPDRVERVRCLRRPFGLAANVDRKIG